MCFVFYNFDIFFKFQTSLQQELQDSVTDQINQISSLQQEVEQLKSSLTQREDQITALKAELKVEPPAKVGYFTYSCFNKLCSC